MKIVINNINSNYVENISIEDLDKNNETLKKFLITKEPTAKLLLTSFNVKQLVKFKKILKTQ